VNIYLILFYTHVTSALTSITFFMVRGCWMLTDHALLQHRFVRIAPHVVDTVLLASAIALTVTLSQYPFVNNWLTVKFFALVGYIILGTIALRRGKTKFLRTLALVAAILLFGFIVSVAWYHHPLGFLLWFRTSTP